MPKDTETYGVADAENPRWTKEKFDRSIGFNELPLELQLALKRGKRGLQKAPTKRPVTIRLSQDVLTILRAKGRGWQTLVDDTLREQFLKRS